MQITIARQLGLDSSTVSNFFMNARRRSLDKWREDSPPSIHLSSPSSLDCTIMSDTEDSMPPTAVASAVQTISLPAGLTAAAGIRTILVRTGNGGQATVITGTPASIYQQLNEISPALTAAVNAGQIELWQSETAEEAEPPTAVDNDDNDSDIVSIEDVKSPLNTAATSQSHTVYIIPRDRLPPNTIISGHTGGGLVTLATASGTHQLRLEDVAGGGGDDLDDEDSGLQGLLVGGHVVLADHQEILETKEVLTDEHCLDDPDS